MNYTFQNSVHPYRNKIPRAKLAKAASIFQHEWFLIGENKPAAVGRQCRRQEEDVLYSN